MVLRLGRLVRAVEVRLDAASELGNVEWADDARVREEPLAVCLGLIQRSQVRLSHVVNANPDRWLVCCADHSKVAGRKAEEVAVRALCDVLALQKDATAYKRWIDGSEPEAGLTSLMTSHAAFSAYTLAAK